MLKISDYYNQLIVAEIGGRFRGTELTDKNTAICPLHEDHDPSMGVLNPGTDKERFHCFGCGRSGNIISLHKRVMKLWKKIDLSDEETKADLEKRFGVKIEAGGSGSGRGIGLKKKIELASKMYGLGDLRVDLREAKKAGGPKAGALALGASWIKLVKSQKEKEEL